MGKVAAFDACPTRTRHHDTSYAAAHPRSEDTYATETSTSLDTLRVLNGVKNGAGSDGAGSGAALEAADESIAGGGTDWTVLGSFAAGDGTGALTVEGKRAGEKVIVRESEV